MPRARDRDDARRSRADGLRLSGAPGMCRALWRHSHHPASDMIGRAMPERVRRGTRGWNQATDAASPPVHRARPSVAPCPPGPSYEADRHASTARANDNSPRGDVFGRTRVQPVCKLWRAAAGQRDALRRVRAAAKPDALTWYGRCRARPCDVTSWSVACGPKS